MLREALELDSFPGDPVFDVPWRYISRLTHPQVLQQLRKRHCQTAPRPQCILLIHVTQVDLKQEKLDEWFRIRQALQHRIHEARVSQILQASQTGSYF